MAEQRDVDTCPTSWGGLTEAEAVPVLPDVRGCQHHFDVDAVHESETDSGECRHCGEQREFKKDVSYPAPVRSVATTGYAKGQG